ncbi:Galactose-1-phosphate uridylyltransferase [Neolecta irregularis DAH-3]|uniref:Galactose-1-phosphate uridylyltransferase n=1 Tax=Neolecta irregularis (strain DAH-3) TaxID=1198029 RepID=A0A1U7LSQ3_NEOID|nr:Galactose-1-phosphate uridylyltransferase [Neolecta irregularis DAH-3]|eukprot:OLL25706.1 Galactose-1-phosphate uridylyltransferase [Neolecta irregularis DAH-3]
MELNGYIHPHRRFNPLLDEWILVSPHRMQRPWLGAKEAASEAIREEFDPTCYLCPGNRRMNGELNDSYSSTFVFKNDFAALKNDTPICSSPHGLLQSKSVQGECFVICFSPRHDLTLAEMSFDELVAIITQWVDLTRKLKDEQKCSYVQIFENKGSAMGCSNPHPQYVAFKYHATEKMNSGQVWSTNYVPTVPQRELNNQLRYRQENNGKCMLCEYIRAETSDPEQRIISQNENWICLVPFWATWPFETLVVPRRCISSLLDLSVPELEYLSKILQDIMIRYDNLFQCSFPYGMGIHQSPLQTKEGHLHIHFFPPLLRSKDIKKFLVGFEMLGESQRDLTPEMATKKLRDLSAKHYKAS